ncbi:MAG: hypothetical protein S4CHLAM27_12240 [Chlamydiia bacterium]|nr:hypothetical protein [Chlamydiia bacterium]
MVAIDENMEITFANNVSLKLLRIKQQDVLKNPYETAKRLPCYNLIEECQKKREPLIDTWTVKRGGKKQVIPLLVIECKAVPINQKAFDQVIGYNHLVQAPFLALANGKEVFTLIKDGSGYRQQKGLPEYKFLLESVGAGDEASR